MSHVVIVGGSVAGFSVAAALRDADFSGDITIIDPHHTALDRPPLSTEFLTDDDVDLALAPPEWFTEHRVTWVQDTAITVGPGYVTTETQRFAADHIVLATGASPKTLALNVPVLTLRTLADAEALRSALRPGTNVAIAGGGLLAPELATSALARGANVTVFTPQVPGLAVFGEDLAHRLYAMMRDRAHVIERRLTPEEPLDEFDLVIAAVGVTPNVSLAQDSGVIIDDGIIVDADYRTNIPGMYAIGDVSRVQGQPRQEHWDHGRASAARVVHTIMGTTPETLPPPWVWSDQFGHDVQVIGRVVPRDDEQLIRRGDDVVFVVDGEELIGAAALDDQQVIRAATRIMTRGIAVDPAQLANPAIPIRRLTK